MDFINHAAFLANPRKIIGIMTGTSLDGIDISLAEFSLNKSKVEMKTLAAAEFALPAGFSEKVLEMVAGRVAMADFSAFNFLISEVFAETVLQFLADNGITRAEIDAIGVHGQTVWHDPHGHKFLGREVRSTLQLGNISALAKMSGITTVGDFRSGDVALGGEGAPLVPIFDCEFLADDNENIIALNIGGISNITIIPAGVDRSSVRAFDTGPGNMLMDLYARKLLGKPYDEGGRAARQGRVHNGLLEKLKEEPYIYAPPPKSTGRELFDQDFVAKAMITSGFAQISPDDLMATLNEFTVFCISDNINRYGFTKGRIYASGGGIKNEYLMERLWLVLPEFIIESCAERGIDPEFKEALCFGYLAWLVLAGRSGNMASVTGAKSDSLIGLIGLP